MTIITQLPSAEESDLAKLSSRELSALLELESESQTLNFIGKDGESHTITLPTRSLRLMIEVLTQFGQGNSVRITPIHAVLTTQEGADMLNMSHPTFIKLLDTGKIPHVRSGNRRKVTFNDIQTYKNKQIADRLSSLNELSELDQELGLDCE